MDHLTIIYIFIAFIAAFLGVLTYMINDVFNMLIDHIKNDINLIEKLIKDRKNER